MLRHPEKHYGQIIHFQDTHPGLAFKRSLKIEGILLMSIILIITGIYQ